MTVSRESCLNAVLLIRKETGMTSFDVIGRLRRVLGIRRIGHAGTLDKAAEGLLVVCTGKATRLSGLLMEGRKRYTGVVRLGIRTDSLDREGIVTETRSTEGLTIEMIQNAVCAFKGSISQMPPEFSAIKIAGKRSSDLARKGRPAEMKARPVEIYAIETELIDMDGMTVTIAVECSKGTYIRSLARDIGERLGCGAHLSSLTRTGSGVFSLSDAPTVSELAEALESGSSEKKFLYSPFEALSGWATVTVNSSGARRVSHGAAFTRDEIISISAGHTGVFAVADESQNLIAIAEINNDNWSVVYKSVLTDSEAEHPD